MTNEEISLDDLRQQFLDVQEEKDTVKLSDRNVIELVFYLKSKKLLENLIFTLDGKEYLTEKQLEWEVLQEIEYSGGRIRRTDIPPLLNVDISNIERITEKMLKENSDLILIGTELITEKHLISVCEEIEETLQESGILHISSLTNSLQLPPDFIQKFITKYTGSIIQGRLDKDTLFTNNYIQREKSRLRGTLCAFIRPVSLSEIREQFHDALFDQLLKELLKEKKLLGSISKDVYVPKIYEQAVQEAVVQYIKLNGYIEYSKVEEWLTHTSMSSKNYISQKCQGIILLNQFAVTTSLRDSLDGVIEESISQNTPMNILNMDVLPLQFEYNDVKNLIESCPSMKLFKDKVQIFVEVYFIPVMLLDEFLDKFKEEAKKNVKKLINESTVQPEKEIESDEEDDKKKKKKKRNKKKEKVIEEDPIDLILPKPNDIWKLLLEKFRKWNLDYEQDEDELKEEMVEYLLPKIKDIYVEEKNKISIGFESERKKLIKDARDNITKLFLEVQVYNKGISYLKDDDEFNIELEKFLLRSKCTELINDMVKDQALTLHIDHELEEKKIFKEFPKNIIQPLNTLKNCLHGSSMSNFLTQLSKCSEDLHYFYSPLDKKKEKKALMDKKYETKEKILKETNSSELFLSLCEYVFIVKGNFVIHASGKHVQNLVKHLKKLVDEDIYEQILVCQNYVISYISNQRKDEKFEEYELMLQKLEELKKSILK